MLLFTNDIWCYYSLFPCGRAGPILTSLQNQRYFQRVYVLQQQLPIVTSKSSSMCTWK